MSPKAICPGDWVFVTGVSGLIGSHVADHLLARGIHVRGAVRDSDEAAMMSTIFSKRHPAAATFEPRIIADMKLPGAFDTHVDGVQGIVHIASDLSFNPDPEVVITGCVNAVKGLLQAAQRSPSVARVVYTSSSNAATNPEVGMPERKVDADTWNEGVLDKAFTPPPHDPEHGYVVYAASKYACEKAAWDFVKTEKPGFAFSTVLPNYTIGTILQPLSVPGAGSTARWVRDAFEYPEREEYVSRIRDQPPQWAVDVEDVAKLHLAVLLFEDVRGERLLGFAHRFDYGSFLDVFGKLAPERRFPDVIGPRRMPSTVVDGAKSVELLRRFGLKSWTSFDESVRRSCLCESVL